MPNFVYRPPMSPFITIVYQDDDVVVFNKASGLLSVPGRLEPDSLWQRAQRVWPELKVVHRLDMATSGLIVMAIGKPAQSHLSRQFQQRRTAKTYYAEIYGHPADDEGEVNLPIRCDWPNRPKQIVDFELGKAAQTQWQVLERRAHTCLVELKPITGRTHQLRVHMQQIGCPIAGDGFYATPDAIAYSERLHLHAAKLGFFHPSSEKWLEFDCQPPF
ncbi:pseudouridine synthase [Agarivorans sp. MS3-6]|uniref:pseudouridine synthase n=1 Tax=Agarivorans sp. TSD2052 TaxID=2937286 RepID=UPI00200E4697|nr:pseudouridine synthase [Agarivorans sp. TSD2052]UPW18022.1 pseudouridine synthase [Agarivorans sp. TSD2052]